MILTKHAETRIQQRCIPKLVLDLLLEHGAIEHQHGGTELVYFKTKNFERARKKLERTLKEFDKLREAYLVKTDQDAESLIITAGYLKGSPRTKNESVNRLLTFSTKVKNMRDRLESKLEVAGFLEKIINRSTYSQKEIAEMCGFNTPNIITMLKQGATKVPVEKIPALAKALDIDRVEFFELVMKNYRPKEYEVIVEIFGEPISDAERAIIKLLRQIIPAGQLVNNTNHYRNKIRVALEN